MNYEEFINEWENNKSYIIARSSGSTGKPKEIKLPKDFVKESAVRTNNFFGINSNCRLYSCVSPDFIGGKMMAVRALLANAELSWETPSNDPLKKSLPSDKPIDLLAVVPSQMHAILDNLSNLPIIRNIIVGGSPIHPDLAKKIEISGLNVFETYGMTETASHIALRRVHTKPIPFSLFPGIEIELNENNCIKIKFENGTEIQTNDIAELITENSFFILGRQDEVIISGAKKIFPSVIENKIRRLIKNEICITGFPDEKWGEKIILLIEKEEGFNVTTSELKECLKTVLKNWEMPKEIYYVKSLPRTSNGKIKRPKDLSSLVFVSPCNNLVCGEQNMQE